jgi:hypothetical protein
MLYVKGTAFWVYMLYMHVCMPYAYLNLLFANSQCGVHMLSVCVCVCVCVWLGSLCIFTSKCKFSHTQAVPCKGVAYSSHMSGRYIKHILAQAFLERTF